MKTNNTKKVVVKKAVANPKKAKLEARITKLLARNAVATERMKKRAAKVEELKKRIASL